MDNFKNIPPKNFSFLNFHIYIYENTTNLAYLTFQCSITLKIYLYVHFIFTFHPTFKPFITPQIAWTPLISFLIMKECLFVHNTEFMSAQKGMGFIDFHFMSTLFSPCTLHLTLRLLMSYIYGAPSKARKANVVYIWTYVWQRWNSLFLFAAHCFNTESMQRGFLCNICV